MSASGQVVLVVEDDELNMRLCHDLLQAHGCSVVQASDGNSGWWMAQRHRPDLILLDIQIPGITGLEVLARLKADKSLQAIPVIAFTAFAMKGDKECFLRRGFDHYIPKPISVSDFLQTIENFLSINSPTKMVPYKI
jgi:two-component system cell cycle response regulator DivK